jgi:hypothetical protein
MDPAAIAELLSKSDFRGGVDSMAALDPLDEVIPTAAAGI